MTEIRCHLSGFPLPSGCMTHSLFRTSAPTELCDELILKISNKSQLKVNYTNSMKHCFFSFYSSVINPKAPLFHLLYNERLKRRTENILSNDIDLLPSALFLFLRSCVKSSCMGSWKSIKWGQQKSCKQVELRLRASIEFLRLTMLFRLVFAGLRYKNSFGRNLIAFMIFCLFRQTSRFPDCRTELWANVRQGKS